MYCKFKNNDISMLDFGQSWSIELDMNHPLIQVAQFVPWSKFENDYRNLFPSHTGRSSFSFRTAFATLILSAYTKLADRKLCTAISENPYYQYFIGFSSYTTKLPFCHTTIQNFRKRINPEMVMKINNELCDYINSKVNGEIEAPANTQYMLNLDNSDKDSNEDNKEIVFDDFNFGTAIIDATCSPSYIKYPQDYQLINDARLLTEKYIDRLYLLSNKEGLKPRTYRRNLNKKFVKVSKMKRKSTSELRSLKLLLLNAINRNIRYIDDYKNKSIYLPHKDEEKLEIVKEIYNQQKYMFDNHTNKVKNRIVSLDQPFLRPIVRGKVKSPVEFGLKYDLCIHEDKLARFEKVSFDPYNESQVLIDAIKKFKMVKGCYPERVLVDQIYRTRENIKFCKDHNIRISGPKLGRPIKSDDFTKKEKAQNKKDNIDRIEVERFFSKTKRCYGANIIRNRLKETTITTVVFTVIAANLFSLDLTEDIFLYYFFWIFEDYKKIDEIIFEL